MKGGDSINPIPLMYGGADATAPANAPPCHDPPYPHKGKPCVSPQRHTGRRGKPQLAPRDCQRMGRSGGHCPPATSACGGSQGGTGGRTGPIEGRCRGPPCQGSRLWRRGHFMKCPPCWADRHLPAGHPLWLTQGVLRPVVASVDAVSAHP